MAKGYHSRSPEEFQEYLKNIKKNQKSAFWKQIIIFVDILIIMVIFYVVYNLINPANISQVSSKDRQTLSGIQLSISISEVFNKEGARLYLLMENKTDKPVSVPGEWILEYKWKNKDDKLCEDGRMQFFQSPQNLEPNNSGLLELFVPPPRKTGVDPTCEKEYFQKRKPFGIGSFQKRILSLQLSLHDKSNDESVHFQIPLNPFP